MKRLRVTLRGSWRCRVSEFQRYTSNVSHLFSAGRNVTGPISDLVSRKGVGPAGNGLAVTTKS